ncbi:MAG: hypothetical protein ACREJM_08595, partial [Candidatus Saccharimonadales bacterium]
MLGYSLLVLGCSMLLGSIYLQVHYAATSPRSPRPAIGKVIPMNAHGTTVFLTGFQDSMLSWL